VFQKFLFSVLNKELIKDLGEAKQEFRKHENK
jgi:hypothetical protein